MIHHSAHCGTHTLAARGRDMYETPPCAVRSLLEVEALPPGAVWEPACGRGNIVRVLGEFGYRTYATDLHDYGSPEQDAAGIDFLHGPVGGGCMQPENEKDTPESIIESIRQWTIELDAEVERINAARKVMPPIETPKASAPSRASPPSDERRSKRRQ